MEKLILIDGNSLLNRAFYATPVFTTKDGVPTNGVFGFIKLMLKIISDRKPAYLAVAFDLRAPTFRHKMYADYKAGRKGMPEELAVQVPILKETLSLMGIAILEKEGFEADDIIGTLSKKFDVQTYIYTGDRDSYQLVDPKTNVCYTRKGVSDILELSAANFFDEIRLTPSQIIDLKSLMGDKSDNIPGVAGIGEKTAMTLLEKYADLDGVYAHIEEIGGATHKKLSESKESAYFSKTLATIDVHVPLEVELPALLLKTPFPYAVKEKFAELEFKSLLSKDIFEEEGAEKTEIGEEKPSFCKILPQTLAEGIAYYEADRGDTIACEWQENAFCFSFGDGTEYFFPIKVGLLDIGFYEDEFAALFRKIFTGEKRIVAYNVKALMHRLERFSVPFTAKYEDVSLLKCLAEGLGNTDGLEYCITYHGYSAEYKVCAVYDLFVLYAERLNEQEQTLYKNVELPLVRVLYDMEKQGVCVDRNVLATLSEKYEAELSELVGKIHELAGEVFNVNSTQQLGKILFEKLKIGDGVKKKKDSARYKTTAEELEKYADESEIVRYLLRYRKIQKLNSTYIEGFKPLIEKGRVHTTYGQSNTQTGRLSSLNPNLQNIPVRTEEGRELRKLFVASEGNVLIDADYSQIELRLLAHFSGCKELIDGYCNGADIHKITAAQVFGVAPEEVTSSMRREAKAVNFGIIYGISAFGLSKDLHISTKKAQEYIQKYFERYSDVKEYLQENVEKAKKDGYVTTLSGRRRVINELASSNYTVRSFGERAAMNMPLQGSSADIIKIAMIRVADRLQKEGLRAKLVLQVHDELLIDSPKEEADRVAEILKETMETAVELRVPLTVDVQMGANWYESK